MSSNPVIQLENLGKCYHIYNKPHERLLQMLVRQRKQYYRESWVLKDVNLEIGRGESLGIIGRNGAGKSTLLQLVCGTLNPTTGKALVRGRVAALLELGSGFNPEFSGRENVFLNASILGLSHEEITDRYEEIVEFSGIREFIDQPVKTYSSGMYVRLAFSVATCVDPDILIIDEALSVGDAEFSRKSFDRIMELRQGGTTILFCSHSLYQVETLCSRALWLDRGSVKMLGDVSSVSSAYQSALDKNLTVVEPTGIMAQDIQKNLTGGYLKKVVGRVGLDSSSQLNAVSQHDTLTVSVDFKIDPALPTPSIALGISNKSGVTISSVISVTDGICLRVDANGEGTATIVFPQIALMKGIYFVTVFLACEDALHMYDIFERCLTLKIVQNNSLQGVVNLAHDWQV